jgi:hypothetical protein
MLIFRPKITKFLQFSKRYFSTPLLQKKFDNGQNTNINLELGNSKVNIKLNSEWIDHTQYNFYDNDKSMAKTHSNPLKIEDIDNQETATWTESAFDGEDTLLDIVIPQDIATFDVSTQGDVSGHCNHDSKFVVHKK